MWRKGNCHVFLMGMQVGAAIVENSEELSKKIKNGTSGNISTSEHVPKKSKILIQKNICTLISTVALITVAEIWKQPISG